MTYHVHIPQPDPMVNPSTLKRQTFYAVRGVPSYSVDGESSGGGGAAEGAQNLFDSKIEPLIQTKLKVPAEAKIDVQGSATATTVTAKVNVSKVASKSAKLKLQIALVEEQVRYSGENGVRFHSMVVRSLAEPAKADKDSTGFALKPGQGGTFTHSFDLAAIAAAAKAHLEDFEENTRKGQYHFREKKHEMDASKLKIVAFVQDEETKKILQAVYFDPASNKKS